ncbi:MAG: TAXI family TRAP transporter solute-binding subunit [Defluviitaleaceae bacterium]|nr:TAXI family TRAP transporter solute-binding subunit [Defluviitaleaceae bacterium]
MSKKKLFLILSLTVISMLFFVACGNDDDDDNGTGTPQVPAAQPGAAGTGEADAGETGAGETPELPTRVAAIGARDVNDRFIFATGGVAGTYYPLGGAMATVINNHTGLNVTITSTGASVDNIQQIGMGDADIAIVQNDVMYFGFTGTSMWGERPQITNMGTLMSLYPETVQIVVLADSDINSVNDLAGQRVSVGALGSGVNANASQVLAAYGLTFDDINEFHLNFADSAAAMQDFNLDAFFVTASTPNTAVQELSRNRDLRIIPISASGAATLMSNYAFYVPITITADDGYDFVTEPIETVAVQATLIASLDTVSNDAAFEIVRALIQNQPEVAIGHARGAYISVENAIQSISVPFHPGALQFFQEAGVLD